MGRPYVSTYFSPGRGAADTVIGFIDRTEQTLDVAIYSLTHDMIARALVRAHERGVKVRVLIDKTQAGSRYADDEYLEAHGIEVRRDRQTGSMHAKYAICDVNSPNRHAVACGSFNWTKNADKKNVEHFTVIRLKYVVEEFHQHFGEIWGLNA